MRNVLRLVCLSVSLGLGLCLVAPSLAAVDITLDSPLTTVVPLNGTLPAGGTIFTATCTVPADAPADLGVGAYVTDHHGRWFQRLRPGNLQPGTQSVTIVFNDDEPVTGIDATWDGAQSAAIVHGGLFFWSASAKRTVIGVTDLRAESLAAAISPAGCLAEVQTDHVTATTGERWQVHFRPQPFPQNPYDPAEFTVDLVVTRPDGTTQRIPGFSEMPMLGHDRGDHEEVLPDGRAVFSARWRPSQPGVYHLRLEAHWVSGAKATSELAPVNVGGAPSMPYVSIDPVDPRFFTIAGAPFWPVGPNLRAVTDPRCTERLHTIATPDRGTLAYADFFARLAPHGVNAAELWLSSWNLALEWRGDWPEFAGLGRYSQERAWRLDRILDLAWQNGIRLNLVINNHGQVSEDTDREWQNNPYSRANGGFIDDALQYFIDPRALARQDALRRYIAGRYADHPGVLGWKLWSEQDLTVAGRRDKIDVLATWHAQAAARWGVLDTYHHPLTTHWSGNFRRVFPSVAMLPGIDFLTIDAYHEPFDGSGKGQLLAELLLDSTGLL